MSDKFTIDLKLSSIEYAFAYAGLAALRKLWAQQYLLTVGPDRERAGKMIQAISAFKTRLEEEITEEDSKRMFEDLLKGEVRESLGESGKGTFGESAATGV